MLEALNRSGKPGRACYAPAQVFPRLRRSHLLKQNIESLYIKQSSINRSERIRTRESVRKHLEKRQNGERKAAKAFFAAKKLKSKNTTGNARFIGEKPKFKKELPFLIEETGRASLNNTNEKPQKEKAATRQNFFHFDDPNAFLDFC